MRPYTADQLHARLLGIADDPSWAGAHRAMAKNATGQLAAELGYAIAPVDLSDEAIKAALYNACVGRLGAGAEFLR